MIGRRVGELFGAYGARWQLASDEVCRSTTQGRQSKQLGDPWVSPDQRTIYFASTRDGGRQIYMATR